jgi:hypothetical protein
LLSPDDYYCIGSNDNINQEENLSSTATIDTDQIPCQTKNSLAIRPGATVLMEHPRRGDIVVAEGLVTAREHNMIQVEVFNGSRSPVCLKPNVALLGATATLTDDLRLYEATPDVGKEEAPMTNTAQNIMALPPHTCAQWKNAIIFWEQ